MARVRQSPFSGTPASTPVTADLVFDVEFHRDTLATLSKKTCAEFNVDVTYFRTTFPEMDTRDMPVANLIVGMFVVMAPKKPDAAVVYLGYLNAAARNVIAACATKPELLYLDAFLLEAKAAAK